MNFDNFCRLCRKVTDSDSLLISEKVKGVAISEILTFTMFLNFDPVSSKFPQKICKDCFETVRKFYELQKEATKNDFYFREFFEKVDLNETPKEHVKPKKAKTPKKMRLFCDQCDKSFERKDSLENHLRVQHSDEILFMCQVRGKFSALWEKLSKKNLNFFSSTVEKIFQVGVIWNGTSGKFC